jgi:hypothetical protein
LRKQDETELNEMAWRGVQRHVGAVRIVARRSQGLAGQLIQSPINGARNGYDGKAKDTELGL